MDDEVLEKAKDEDLTADEAEELPRRKLRF